MASYPGRLQKINVEDLEYYFGFTDSQPKTRNMVAPDEGRIQKIGVEDLDYIDFMGAPHKILVSSDKSGIPESHKITGSRLNLDRERELLDEYLTKDMPKNLSFSGSDLRELPANKLTLQNLTSFLYELETKTYHMKYIIF